MIRIGVIGYGNRANQVVRLVERLDPAARIVAIADPAQDAVRKRLAGEKFIKDKPEDIRFYTDADAMLAKEKDLSGVFVCTRCSLHTTMACKVAKTGLPLYLEKPVSTTMADARKLARAFETSKSRVVVSFPLRLSQLVEVPRKMIAAGEIGTLEQVQAVNNVPYGAGYFRNWYRDYEETGGLWLQKATHDLDYINYIMGEEPTTIFAMESQRVFGRRKPKGLTCDKCKEFETCPESPYADFFPRFRREQVDVEARKCVFSKDINPGYSDNGSALIEYASGRHATYSQNFFVSGSAGFRGATLIGYKGSISFDWYSGKVKVVKHHRGRTDILDFGDVDGHGGGDEELVRNFIDLMRGGRVSRSPIEAGILSAYLCLKARESAQTRTVQKVDVSELTARSKRASRR